MFREISHNIKCQKELYLLVIYYRFNKNNETIRQQHYQEVSFEPGTAILHRGMTKHGARPLREGQRDNLVIWVHGEGGYVRVAPYPEDEQMTARERWSMDTAATSAKDGDNPFGDFGGFGT